MNRREQIIKLAEGVLDEVSTHGAAIEHVVNKAHRLATLVGDEHMERQLHHEAVGFRGHEYEPTRNWLIVTYRWNGTDETSTNAPAATLEGLAKAARDRILTIQLHVPTGQWAASLSEKQVQSVQKEQIAAIQLEKVLSNVRTQIYRFASQALAKAQFSETSADIFHTFQSGVDAGLAGDLSDVFERMPHVFERLSEGSPEAISHALTSSRRIIDGYANLAFPARSEPVDIAGQLLDCGAGKTRNQLRAHIHVLGFSKSRTERLMKNMTLLYDRVSTGVHAEVSADEAAALVLNTYLLLGELVAAPRA